MSLFSCEKGEEIQDSHFKELVGEWRTVTDSERKTIIVAADGKVVIRHSAERGESFMVNQFFYGDTYLSINEDTLANYTLQEYRDGNIKNFIFFKKENVDSAYDFLGDKINNQVVNSTRSLYTKVK